MTRVLGVDLSLTSTGLALAIAGGVSADCETATHGRRGISSLPLTDRVHALGELRDDLLVEIGSFRPRLVVIENLPAARIAGVISHEKTWLWWEVVRGLVLMSVPVVECSVAQVKQYATGRGNARKAEVVDAVARRMPMFVTHGDDNRADAATLAAIGADLIGMPVVEMPAMHRKALTKLRSQVPAGLGVAA